MNTKYISTVVSLALMATMSVSTAHAMQSKGPSFSFGNACKKLAVNAVSSGVSSFTFTNAGLYLTTGVHLFSGARAYLMPFSYFVLANGVITGLTGAYNNYGDKRNYTKEDMKTDIRWRFVYGLQSAPFYTFIIYCLQLIH